MTLTNEKTFGDWLREERERKNLIPAELARRAGVKPQYISNLENNVPNKQGKLTIPSPDVCRRLAAALGVHPFEALQAAGHLPEELPATEVSALMAADYVYSLPTEKQEEVIRYLKYIFDEFGDANKMRARAPKHPAVASHTENSPAPVAATTPIKSCDSESVRYEDEKQTHIEPPAKKTGKNGGR